MYTFAYMLFEMKIRTSSLQAEAEQERWARVAASSRSGDWASRLRRTAVLVVDYAAGLRCLLQRRFAADASTMAC